MTNGWVDIKNTDVILAMGGNPAENHPVGFKWFMEARRGRNAKLVVVDPRFTRTAAVADLYAPIRPGSDIAFLLGIIRYALETKRYHEDYVKLHTNAPYIISDKYSFNDGLFSGFDPKTAEYAKDSWAYEADSEGGAYKVDPHAAGPALRVPAAEAARRPLHARDGRADLRHAEGLLPEGGRAGDLDRQRRSGSAPSPTRWAGPSTPPACR